MFGTNGTIQLRLGNTYEAFRCSLLPNSCFVGWLQKNSGYYELQHFQHKSPIQEDCVSFQIKQLRLVMIVNNVSDH